MWLKSEQKQGMDSLLSKHRSFRCRCFHLGRDAVEWNASKGPHMCVRHSPSLCERFLASRAAVTGDAVVLGQLSGSMDGWSGSTVMKSFLWLSYHVGPASLPRSRSSSLVLRAVGRVEMVWKGKWRLALWLFWHTIQALTAQFSAQVIPVQNNRIWLWLNRTFLRLL